METEFQPPVHEQPPQAEKREYLPDFHIADIDFLEHFQEGPRSEGMANYQKRIIVPFEQENITLSLTFIINEKDHTRSLLILCKIPNSTEYVHASICLEVKNQDLWNATTNVHRANRNKEKDSATHFPGLGVELYKKMLEYIDHQVRVLGVSIKHVIRRGASASFSYEQWMNAFGPILSEREYTLSQLGEWEKTYTPES